MTGVKLLRVLRDKGFYVCIGPDPFRSLGPEDVGWYPWNETGTQLNQKLDNWLKKLARTPAWRQIEDEMIDILAIRRCPVCGNPAYSWGPEGIPQRRCHACRHTWTPKLKGSGCGQEVT